MTYLRDAHGRHVYIGPGDRVLIDEGGEHRDYVAHVVAIFPESNALDVVQFGRTTVRHLCADNVMIDKFEEES